MYVCGTWFGGRRKRERGRVDDGREEIHEEVKQAARACMSLFIGQNKSILGCGYRCIVGRMGIHYALQSLYQG